MKSTCEMAMLALLVFAIANCSIRSGIKRKMKEDGRQYMCWPKRYLFDRVYRKDKISIFAVRHNPRCYLYSPYRNIALVYKNSIQMFYPNTMTWDSVSSIFSSFSIHHAIPSSDSTIMINTINNIYTISTISF